MKPHPPTAGLRPGIAAAGSGNAGEGGASGSGSARGVGFDRRLAAWWNGLQQPLALRISQGMALVVIWVGLAVVFLAYLVGHNLGVRAGREQVQGDGSGPIPAAMAVHPAGAPSGVASPAASSIGGVIPGTTVDPRQAGMSYFIIASFPVGADRAVARREAHDLVAFLEAKGVDAAAILPHNRRFYEVAVLQPFAPAEQFGSAAQQCKDELLHLGEAYVRVHRSGFDLKNMYLKPQKQSEVVDDLIVKENIQ